jgi:hypothetical protein
MFEPRRIISAVQVGNGAGPGLHRAFAVNASAGGGAVTDAIYGSGASRLADLELLIKF